ncbi:MAG: T9SS type A sorting domain-containing protein, partial [Candidatus Eisenbacteria bacterium]|nr:T9SS type A sorting domain-containing protein [Candidatus Eisenbacteria bacterium]
GDYAYCWQKAPYASPCLSTSNTLELSNVQPVDAGTYRVVVTESCGCSDTCYVQLTVLPLPVCEISGAPAVCAGSTTEWCAPAPPPGIDYSYSWTGPGGFISAQRCVSVGTSGTYSVTITDSHGCQCTTLRNLLVYGLPSCSITRTGGERDTICPCFDETDPAANNEYCGPAGMAAYAWLIVGGADITAGAAAQCVIVRPHAHCDTTFTLYLTVTDAHGCTSSCERTVFVVDKTPPVIVYCPPDTVLECNDNLDDAFNPLAPVSGPGMRDVDVSTVWQPVSLDDCDASPGADYADTGGRPTNWSRRVDSWGSCGEDTTVLRTWTVTDDCGNQAVCHQVIAIQDTVPPMLTCAPNDTVPCGTDVVFTPPPSVADNCDPLRLLEVLEVSTDVVPGPGAGEFTHTRCWVAADSCGNASALCCQSIIVEACPEEFCTFTPGGWGSECPPDQEGNPLSTQPGCILQHYFGLAFPGGSVRIGDPAGIGGGEPNLYAAVWTNPDAVGVFLPAAGTSGMLTQDALNPVSTSAGVLAGHILALRLNVEFSCSGAFREAGLSDGVSCYGGFVIPASCGKFAGLTVEQFLAVADQVVGGRKNALNPYRATFSDLNFTATCLNQFFNNCTASASYAAETSDGRRAPLEALADAPADGSTAEEASPALVPERFFVRQSYPNPFNPSATIVFGLPHDGRVTVEICDVVGRNVVTLLDAARGAGYHSAVWFGGDSAGNQVASGVYFCRVRFGEQASVQKLILLR